MNPLLRWCEEREKEVRKQESEESVGVIHPIDIEEGLEVESCEEREWRIEQNTLIQKGMI